MTGHRVTWFAPDRPVDGTTIYARPDLTAAALIDQLMCRDCGTSLVADVADVKGHAQEAVVTYQRCPCLAASPEEAVVRAAYVRQRHTAAVEQARLTGLRWVAAQNRRAAW